MTAERLNLKYIIGLLKMEFSNVTAATPERCEVVCILKDSKVYDKSIDCDRVISRWSSGMKKKLWKPFARSGEIRGNGRYEAFSWEAVHFRPDTGEYGLLQGLPGNQQIVKGWDYPYKDTENQLNNSLIYWPNGEVEFISLVNLKEFVSGFTGEIE